MICINTVYALTLHTFVLLHLDITDTLFETYYNYDRMIIEFEFILLIKLFLYATEDKFLITFKRL